MKTSRFVLAAVIVLLLLAFFAFDLGRYLDPAFLKQQQLQINAYYLENPWRSIAIYFVLYVLMAALSLPGAIWVTLIGGAIFGVAIGSIVISFGDPNSSRTLGTVFEWPTIRTRPSGCSLLTRVTRPPSESACTGLTSNPSPSVTMAPVSIVRRRSVA